MDEAVRDVAEQVAARFSRRSILHNLAAGVAAVVGVKFVAPHVVDTLIRMPQAEGAPVPQGGGGKNKIICNHNEADPCSLNGVQCGMGNSVDCAAYKKNDTSKGPCRNCMKDKYCPKGTKKGPVQWRICCKCLEADHPGHYFDYWDCCTDPTQVIPPECTNAACDAAVTDSGCNNPAGCAVPGEGNPWCGLNSDGTAAGAPMCTYGIDSRENCKS